MNAEAVFDALAAELAPAGAVAGKMFGARTMTLQKKAFACLQDGVIALKLGADTPAHAAALELPGATLWDPSGRHRPFKDWVAVPATDGRDLVDLAGIALTTLAASFR